MIAVSEFEVRGPMQFPPRWLRWTTIAVAEAFAKIDNRRATGASEELDHAVVARLGPLSRRHRPLDLPLLHEIIDGRVGESVARPATTSFRNVDTGS